VREGEAISYFNAVEATVLVELVEGLLASTQRAGGRGVKPDSLGVMATYRKQVGHRAREVLSFVERVIHLSIQRIRYTAADISCRFSTLPYASCLLTPDM